MAQDVTRYHLPHHFIPPEHYSEDEKHFRPNPDAKPFIPNMHAFPPNWHFYRNENGKNLNVPFIMNPQIESDMLSFPSFSPNSSSKKHIAFHLVSNVLDDEVVEDCGDQRAPLPPGGKFYSKLHSQAPPPQSNPPHPPSTPDQNSFNGNSWQTATSANFALGVEKITAGGEKNSINNKSIHEIWSPDPSPNDLNNLSPSDNDVITTMSPQSQIDSPVAELQNSFEQVALEQQQTQQQEEKEDYYYPQHQVPNYPPPPPQHYRGGNMYHNQKPMHRMYDQEYYAPSRYYNRGYPKMLCEQCGHSSCRHYNHHGGARGRGGPRGGYHHHGNHHPYALQNMYDMKSSLLEKLGINLDACCDQLRHLDRDCKKADAGTVQTSRLRKSSSTDSSPSKYPSNSTRVDKLVLEQEREHQKVESLIGRIERQAATPLHPNVGVILDRWLTAIKDLRNTRKNELASLSELPNGGACNGGTHKSHTETDMKKLIEAVGKLTKQTRAARTVIWCAMQMFHDDASDEAPE